MLGYNYTDKSFSDTEALQNLKRETPLAAQTMSSKRSDISHETASTVVSDVATHFELKTPQEAFVLITGLCQSGGANTSALETASFHYSGITLTARELDRILKRTAPDGTLRQLSRALARDIFRAAKVFDLPGDLSTKFVGEFNDATREEMAAASHFQKLNPEIPGRVRLWLRETLDRR